MTGPAFIPPGSMPGTDEKPPIEQEPDRKAPILTPPLAAAIAAIEAARTSMNAQLDVVVAQIYAIAYTGAVINNARRARSAEPSDAMPATFGARRAEPSAPQRSAQELSDAIESG